MIFVAAGTQDGRELAAFLKEQGFDVTASAVTGYGESLLESHPGIEVQGKPLNEEELFSYISGHGIKAFVDATHPYAGGISKNAMAACARAKVPYIRYERPETPLPEGDIHPVECYAEAAKEAASLGKNIFLTTGSRRLKEFAQSPCLKDCNLTVRVLPTAESVSACKEAGIPPKRIVALQGPFSEELNQSLFREYGADVIVTKNSGKIGGTDTKFAAAKALGLPVVLITRPKLDYGNVANDFENVMEFLQNER